MVAPINLNVDQSIKRKLKNIEEYQTRDPPIQSIKKRLETGDSTVSRRYTTHNRIVYCKTNDQNPLRRIYLLETLETKVINFGHRTLGHAGSDKTLKAIALSFYVKNLGRKVRKTLSHCETCQQVKSPNRSLEFEPRAHLPDKPGELLCVDLYGPLPAAKLGNKYIFVCLNVLRKHVQLHPLRSATTRVCLNKITSKYIPNVHHPKCIISDHGTQFTNQTWRKTLEQLNI
jgi:hypothetical protein